MKNIVSPRCIAIVRLDALGDSLLSLPAAESLRQAYPDSRLIVIASTIGACVFEHIAEVIIVNPKDKNSVNSACQKLREAGCDILLSFTEKRVASYIARKSRAQIRAAFNPGMTQPLKSVFLHFVFNKLVPWKNDPSNPCGCHEVEHYFALTDAIGMIRPNPLPPIRLPIPEETEAKAKNYMESLQLGSAPMAIQLMPRWETLGFGFDDIEAICQGLDMPKVIFAAPPDASWASKWAEKLKLPFISREDIREYAALLKNCRALLSPDGGSVHTASSVGTPVIAIFPEKNAPHCTERWRPWQTKHKLVIKKGGDTNNYENIQKINLACRELCQ
ncbi:MAG: glycosyltransferase family 9 protein [bacterium]|nr:glycosyltransferase family 9 protein [bacterium]